MSSIKNQREQRSIRDYNKKSKSSSSSYNARSKFNSHSHSNSGSDSDGPPESTAIDNSDNDDDGDDFFSNDAKSKEGKHLKNKKINKKRKNEKTNKHAPKESSTKRPVSVIRPIPGLPVQSTINTDIRFDAAFGKPNYDRIRKDYSFLDGYRQNEVDEMKKMLKDKTFVNKLNQHEFEDLTYQERSTRSRLESLRNKDLEDEVVKKYKKDTGKQFIKRGEKRRLLQVNKFESLSARQRSKVMERKRKKKLGKEMRMFDFQNTSKE